MADLIDYQKLSLQNRGYKYILLVIDCFTKMIYIAPLKTKNQFDTAIAFENLLNDLERIPSNLVNDD